MQAGSHFRGLGGPGGPLGRPGAAGGLQGDPEPGKVVAIGCLFGVILVPFGRPVLIHFLIVFRGRFWS